MKPEDKIKVLAELDGYFDVHVDDSMSNKPTLCGTRGEVRNKIVKVYHDIPSYLTNYDPIIRLIQKQPREVKRDFITRIKWFAVYTFECSPEQLCDALIKAVGKWKE